MGEIHELFVLVLSLVWFAGATPDFCRDIKMSLGSGLFRGSGPEGRGRAMCGAGPIARHTVI